MLPQCIRQVMEGEHWIGVESVNALIGGIRAPAGGGSLSLTPREVDIVRRVAKGAGNKDIAWELQMGEQTVKNHLRRIFRKLNVANRVELALLAVEQQIGADAGATGDETRRSKYKFKVNFSVQVASCQFKGPEPDPTVPLDNFATSFEL